MTKLFGSGIIKIFHLEVSNTRNLDTHDTEIDRSPVHLSRWRFLIFRETNLVVKEHDFYSSPVRLFHKEIGWVILRVMKRLIIYIHYKSPMSIQIVKSIKIELGPERSTSSTRWRLAPGLLRLWRGYKKVKSEYDISVHRITSARERTSLEQTTLVNDDGKCRNFFSN